MNKLCIRALSGFVLAGMFTIASAATQVTLETSHGAIVIELDSAKAPNTVANFVQYVKSGFYSGTIFHRVIKGFMIQGGGMTADMSEKPAKTPIKNEASNGLLNMRGTIAMARTSDPHSATCQFFINTVDNAFLNYTSASPAGWGYCVFGKVIKGMEVVDAIENTPTAPGDVPVKTVTITKASIGAAASKTPAALKKAN
jgi:peptidyl-prolyl cis-trans isomerase B (cyclophilin B)